jgi:hypothetical protein
MTPAKRQDLSVSKYRERQALYLFLMEQAKMPVTYLMISINRIAEQLFLYCEKE